MAMVVYEVYFDDEQGAHIILVAQGHKYEGEGVYCGNVMAADARSAHDLAKKLPDVASYQEWFDQCGDYAPGHG